MKKNRIILIITFSFVMIGSILLGSCFLYAKQDTLPTGVRLSDWSVGGMKTAEVLKELDVKLQQLESLPLHISVKDHDIPDHTRTLAEAGVRYDATTFRNAVKQLQTGNFLEQASYRWHFEKGYTLSTHWNSSIMKAHFNKAWEQEHFGVPINATRRISSHDRVVYTPEISAYQLDWETLASRIDSVLPKDFTKLEQASHRSLALQLPLLLTKPELTVKTLKKEGIDRKIMEFSTSLSTSSEGRLFNVQSAAQATDGLILKPEDVFDYGKIVALAEQKYGFREAPVILNGKLVPGIGGGICQVSSTIYSAAIRTGMEVMERRNHSLPVSYLPKGQDATFATGLINFRFKNNTGKHLLIHAVVKDRMLIVKFFGTFPPNIRYDIESITIETLAPSNKYVQNSSLPVGTQEIIQNGKTGYIVDTYQIKKVDGVIQQRKRISHDTYLPQKTLIGVHPENNMNNTSPILPKEKSIVEDGVSGPNF